MNALVMPKSPLFKSAALAATLSLTACMEPVEQPPLQGAAIGGYFELVDSRGQLMHQEDFKGHYSMFYFGYTWCPDVCPFDLNRMMRGYRMFAEENPELAAQIQPVFVTIDPERDTPAIVGEYTSKFGDNLMGLTGTPDQIAQAARAFAVYYERGPDNEQTGYLMDHSNAAILMGRNGEPLALLPVDESAEGVAAELEKWVS